MKEERYYEKLDAADNLGTDFTNGYFPTVEELETLGVAKMPEKHLTILGYFAGDPLKDSVGKMPAKVAQEYKNSVKKCNEIILKIKLEEDEGSSSTH